MHTVHQPPDRTTQPPPLPIANWPIIDWWLAGPPLPPAHWPVIDAWLAEHYPPS